MSLLVSGREPVQGRESKSRLLRFLRQPRIRIVGPVVFGCLFFSAIVGLHEESGGNLFWHLAGRTWHSVQDYPALSRFLPILTQLGLCGVAFAALARVWRLWRRGARDLAGAVPSEGDRSARPVQQPSFGLTLSRRTFMATTLAGGLTLGYGNRVGRYELGLTRRQVGIRGLPLELAGLQVAMMADWHCGPHNSQTYLKSAIDLCNGCHPDLILVPGDLISYDVAYAARAAELLAALRPRIKGGLLVSWGNHDHWHGLSDKPELLDGTGATILVGSSLIDTPGPRGTLVLSKSRHLETSRSGDGGLWVVGIDDLWTGSPDLAASLRGIPEDQPRLVLSHNPDVAEQQPLHRVDLMLSGHTHGGQVRFPLIGAPIVPSRYGQKYAQGWVDGPGYPVFVTRGVGVGGIPVRLGVPPEIVLFELHPA